MTFRVKDEGDVDVPLPPSFPAGRLLRLPFLQVLTYSSPVTEISKRRLRRILKIGFPMMISHASESVMLFVDRLFLSRVSKVHLAAAMGGGITNFMLMSLFVGIVGYVNAIVGQYYGSGQKNRCIVATAVSYTHLRAHET